MLSSRSFWSSRHFPLLAPDGDGGGNGGSNAGAESDSKAGDGDTGDKGKESSASKDDDDLDGIEGLGDKGKAALKAEREARKAAAAEAKAAKEERDALLKEKQEREDAEKQARDKEAAEKGQWQELAEKREGELKSVKDDVTRLTGQIDQYKAAVEKVLADEWKGLPAEAIEAYEAAGGKDDDPLAKLAFLPAGKKIAARLAESGKESARGNGRDPKGSGTGKLPEADKQKAQAGIYHNKF